MRAKKLIASAIAATTIGVGGIAIAAVNPLAGVGAQEEKGAPDTTAVTPDADTSAPEAVKGRAKRGHVLGEVLDDLVTKGTITQAQADAVKAGLKEKIGEKGPRRGHGKERLKHTVTAAAEAIGITPREVLAGLKEGKSIAEIAQANDVEPQAVIDKLVAGATARIDKAVADGKVQADRAAKLKERLPAAMEKLVNHKRTPR